MLIPDLLKAARVVGECVVGVLCEAWEKMSSGSVVVVGEPV